MKRFYIVTPNQVNPNGLVVPVKVVNFQPVELGRPLIKFSLCNGSSPLSLAPGPCGAVPVVTGQPISIYIFSNQDQFVIYAPLSLMRNIIDDIYQNSNPVNDTTNNPKTLFRIVTPTIDAVVNTSRDNMINTVQMIVNKYNGVKFTNDKGETVSLEDIIKKVRST